jgi:hypothetical protein
MTQNGSGRPLRGLRIPQHRSGRPGAMHRRFVGVVSLCGKSPPCCSEFYSRETLAAQPQAYTYGTRGCRGCMSSRMRQVRRNVSCVSVAKIEIRHCVPGNDPLGIFQPCDHVFWRIAQQPGNKDPASHLGQRRTHKSLRLVNAGDDVAGAASRELYKRRPAYRVAVSTVWLVRSRLAARERRGDQQEKGQSGNAPPPLRNCPRETRHRASTA